MRSILAYPTLRGTSTCIGVLGGNPLLFYKPAFEGGGGPSLAMVGGSLLLRNNFTEGETSLNRAEGTTANMLIVLYLFTITQTNLPSHFQCDLNIPSYDGSVLRTQNLPSIKTLRISIDTFLRRKAWRRASYKFQPASVSLGN